MNHLEINSCNREGGKEGKGVTGKEHSTVNTGMLQLRSFGRKIPPIVLRGNINIYMQSSSHLGLGGFWYFFQWVKSWEKLLGTLGKRRTAAPDSGGNLGQGACNLPVPLRLLTHRKGCLQSLLSW